MDLNNLIGYKLDNAINYLQNKNLKYYIIENESRKLIFDTILVVNAFVDNDSVVLVTDKFLLNV